MSSISPIETKKFAKRINELGCDYLDAPVSGGEVGAKNAALTIMVGGPQAAFDKVKPVFELMGKNITLVGGNGDGQTCKVVQPDHRRAQHRGRERSAGVRVQSRRRPCQGAPGADGRLRRFAHPRSARRAHDQAHVRSRASASSCIRRICRSRWPARARSASRSPIPRPRRSSSTPAAPTAAPSGTIRRWSRRSSAWRITTSQSNLFEAKKNRRSRRFFFAVPAVNGPQGRSTAAAARCCWD